jgi:hypothetical protein
MTLMHVSILYAGCASAILLVLWHGILLIAGARRALRYCALILGHFLAVMLGTSDVKIAIFARFVGYRALCLWLWRPPTTEHLLKMTCP